MLSCCITFSFNDSFKSVTSSVARYFLQVMSLCEVFSSAYERLADLVSDWVIALATQDLSIFIALSW